MDEQPVSFSVDYPDRPLNRLTTAFRIFTVIPIAIVLGTHRRLPGGSTTTAHGDAGTVAVGGTGLLFLPPLLMILFRAEVPALVVRLEPRAAALHATGSASTSALMDDRYPSTDEQQSVHLDFPYPDAAARPQPLAAAGQVVPGDPALHRAVLPLHRRRSSS